MALSGSQVTRIGIQGFPGQAYAGFVAKAEAVAVLGSGFGVGSVITNYGSGKEGLINADGIGETGLIVLGFGVGSVIRNNGVGKVGLINNDGVGKEGEI